MTELQRYNGSSVYSNETYTYNWLDQQATDTTAIGSTYKTYYDALRRAAKQCKVGIRIKSLISQFFFDEGIK